MSRYDELLARWEARRADPIVARGLVTLGEIADELIIELRALRTEENDARLTLKEAAATSGYSVDWLQKQVATGAIPNAGRKGKPAIRHSDLPRKPGRALRADANPDQFSPRRRIVHAARQPRSV